MNCDFCDLNDGLKFGVGAYNSPEVLDIDRGIRHGFRSGT